MKAMRHLLWSDERGIETLEWLAVAVLILIVAFAIYPGTLQAGLEQVVGAITTALTGAAGGLNAGGGS
jgi:Flp pilus assembly pilin Flp